MEITSNKGMKLLILATVMMVSFSAFASALGVSVGYWKENPLTLSPGESKEILVNLQNMGNDQDVTVQASLISGSDVAKLTDASTEYVLKANSADTMAHVWVSVPADAAVGSKYDVTISVKTVGNGKGGIVLGSSLQVSFPVSVKEKPAVAQPAPVADNTSMWTLVAAVVIVALLVWFAMKGKSKKKRK